ncbi:MAG: cupin domain-containing protein [Cyanobacteria bacterium P01_D01_bin.73]
MATQVGIKVDANPSEETLSELGVFSWSVWTKEVSEFPWTYDEAETCYFLEGEVTVTPDGGEPVTVGQGQLVTFPAGMSCTWAVTQPVRKHYKFG